MNRFAVRTPIAGLYLSGSDAATPGVPGALMGGVAAASKILGPLGFMRIMAAAYRAKPSMARPATTRSPEKKRATLVAKTAVTPSTWRLDFELDEPIRFAPGQYVQLRVAPFEWRDYSIAAAADKRLTLLISNRTGGDGSIYVDSVAPGATTEIEGPFGGYRLERNAHRKVFVATGTGVAPFLPMFEAMAAESGLDTAELYFGCRDCGGRSDSRAGAAAAAHDRLRQPRRRIRRRRSRARHARPRRARLRSGDDRFLCLRLGRYGGRLSGDSGARRRAANSRRTLLKDRRRAVPRNSWFIETEVFLLHEIVARLDRLARQARARCEWPHLR